MRSTMRRLLTSLLDPSTPSGAIMSAVVSGLIIVALLTGLQHMFR
jgi:hypothetical protein